MVTFVVQFEGTYRRSPSFPGHARSHSHRVGTAPHPRPLVHPMSPGHKDLYPNTLTVVAYAHDDALLVGPEVYDYRLNVTPL